MASDDPPFVSAEPPARWILEWRAERLKEAAKKAGIGADEAREAGMKPDAVLVVRLSGVGAPEFVRDMKKRAETSHGPSAIFAVR
jgi:hypothetical protein